MTDNNNGVRLGDGVKDKVIDNINEKMLDWADIFVTQV